MANATQLQFKGSKGAYYSLKDTCKLLDKARSTIMRLLPRWETVTKDKPIKDHSGKWFLSEDSVHALRDKPKLYLKLAGRATKWEDEQRKLKAENTCLKGIIEGLVSTQELVLLRKANPGANL
jgi:hypothetical protein